MLSLITSCPVNIAGGLPFYEGKWRKEEIEEAYGGGGTGVKTGFLSVAQAGLELMEVLLPQPPKLWDDRCEVPALS